MSADVAHPDLRCIQLATGGQIEVRVHGSGRPLVLMHGVGGNANAWGDFQFEALGAARQLIAWSAPGYGASTPLPGQDPSVDDYAGAALALLDAMGLDQVDLLGHSMGGLVAARLATLAPARVGRLVLADCSSGHKGYDAHKRESILATRLTQDDTDPWAYARARAPKLMAPGASPALIELAASQLAKLRQPGFGQASRMVAQSDLFAFAGDIRASTAVLCGTEDGVTSPELNQRIARAIAGAAYHPIEAAGHWSFLEQPREFARLVNAHLA